jgi:hypothetical protein
VKESLISEPIEPLLEELAERPFLAGEPALPSSFRWRGDVYRIESILESWKEYSTGSRSMPERYLKKHWFRLRVSGGTEMKIYFERSVRSKGGAKTRWWLYTVAAPDDGAAEPPNPSAPRPGAS